MTIHNVCIIGGCLMGRQIALNTAIYPFQVKLTDNAPAVRENVRCWADDYLNGRIAKGRMSKEQVAEIKNGSLLWIRLRKLWLTQIL